MNERVFVPEAGVEGVIVKLMTYGAVVRYTVGGIEFEAMLSEEDYELLTRGMMDGWSIDE